MATKISDVFELDEYITANHWIVWYPVDHHGNLRTLWMDPKIPHWTSVNDLWKSIADRAHRVTWE